MARRTSPTVRHQLVVSFFRYVTGSEDAFDAADSGVTANCLSGAFSLQAGRDRHCNRRRSYKLCPTNNKLVVSAAEVVALINIAQVFFVSSYNMAGHLS